MVLVSLRANFYTSKCKNVRTSKRTGLHLHFAFCQSKATLQIYLLYITIYNHFYLTGVSIGTFQNIDSIGFSLKTLPMYFKYKINKLKTYLECTLLL